MKEEEELAGVRAEWGRGVEEGGREWRVEGPVCVKAYRNKRM